MIVFVLGNDLFDCRFLFKFRLLNGPVLVVFLNGFFNGNIEGWKTKSFVGLSTKVPLKESIFQLTVDKKPERIVYFVAVEASAVLWQWSLLSGAFLKAFKSASFLVAEFINFNFFNMVSLNRT